MIIIGITYSLTFATVWSSIIYIITPEFYGIGLATVVSIYSLFFTQETRKKEKKKLLQKEINRSYVRYHTICINHEAKIAAEAGQQ